MKLFSNEEGSSLKDYRALRGGGGESSKFYCETTKLLLPPFRLPHGP